MRILMINVTCGTGSTGRICTDLATMLESRGHEVKIAYGRDDIPEPYRRFGVRIGDHWNVKLHGLRARLLDGAGFGSRRATEQFIHWVRRYDPDIIHMHNLHGYYIHIGVLFDYLKDCGKRIIWTLHDCWPFTGHCAYFDYSSCNRWKSGCMHCPQKGDYPASIGLDLSCQHYKAKKRIFKDIPGMVLVTPSQWLANLVKQSFIGKYQTTVIHNGIDTAVFHPTQSDVKERFECAKKKIILGVASVWDRRKGLDAFIELSQQLPDDFQIILVGLSKKQIRGLPENIVGIERTESVQELVDLYSAADVFVNPTLEDNYPTTNLEAISCGTPVITYQTGGSPESALLYGTAVPRGDVTAVARLLRASTVFTPAPNLNLDKSATLEQYLKLYLPTQTGDA